MRYGYFALGMILFGVFGLVLIVMFQSITLNNDSEYYVLKEAMEASMIESIDDTCFRITPQVAKELGNEGESCDGQVKISEQKFVENFTRRFASTINGDVDDYTINFYDIMEMPAKASVLIKSSNTNFKVVSDSVDITNSLSGILEANWVALSSDENKGQCVLRKNTDDDSSSSDSGLSDIPNTDSNGTVACWDDDEQPDDVSPGDDAAGDENTEDPDGDADDDENSDE